ncbi:hypothetical protein WA158_007745 [Blastocystis sp. Blastoise]
MVIQNPTSDANLSEGLKEDILVYEELVKNVMNVFTSVLTLGNHFERIVRNYMNNPNEDNTTNKKPFYSPMDSSPKDDSNAESTLWNAKNKKDVDLIRFTNNGPVFKISKKALDQIKGSYVDESCVQECRTNDGTIFLGYEGNDACAYYLLDYLNGEKVDFYQFQYEEQLDLLELFEFCGIPIPIELLDCRERKDNKKKLFESGDPVTLILNGKEDTIITNYLKKEHLWENYIKNCYSGYVYYNPIDNSLFVDKNYQYIDYIYFYMKYGYINVEQDKIININKTTFEYEMYSIFGEIGKQAVKEGIIPLKYFSGSQIIINKEMEAPLVNWIDMIKQNSLKNIFNRKNNKDKKWKLLFRASEHNYLSRDFHKYCDNKGETIVLIKHIGHNNHVNIFGGYTDQNWKCNDDWFFNGWKSYSKEFLFTLSNEHNIPPTKYDYTNSDKDCGIYCDASFGPVFGGGRDLCISDKCHNNNTSFCYAESFDQVNTTPNSSLFVNTSDSTKKNEFIVEDYEVWGRI